MMAFIPELINRKTYNEDGVGGMHVYSPWWLDNKKLDFPRGYHIEVWGGLGAPSYGTGFNVNSFNKFFGINKAGGYGDVLRNDMKKYYGSTIGLSGRGESVAMKSNYCEIDPNKVDKYGVPVLRFNYQWTDNEIKQAKHMQDTFEEIIHNMGAISLWNKPGKESNYGLTKPGQIIHEVGTTRMGSDPKDSVVNEFERLHDVSNVYVVDAGPFVSQADKNPTWTIMALAMRSSEHIVEEFKNKIFNIMNRRDSIKTITFASIGAGLLLEGCYGISSEKIKRSLTRYEYGRTPDEIAYDDKLFAQKFFTIKN